MINGHQTNPLIKDFLAQFPAPDKKSLGTTSQESLTNSNITDYDNFANIEAELDEDGKIRTIQNNIDESIAQNGDDYYQEIKDYPIKKIKSREQELNAILKEERRKRIELQNQKEQRQKKRKDQFKPVRPEDFQKLKQENKENTKGIYKSKIAEELEKQRKAQNLQNSAEIAKNNRNALIDYGKEITENNKKTLPKTIRKKKIITDQIKLPPPFATDINNFSQRINSELKELTILQDEINDFQKCELDFDTLYTKLANPQLNGTEPQGPDYHLQFAMLFQKLDNADQKIKELEEKTDNIVQ